LLYILKPGDALPEGARVDYLLLRRGRIFKRQVGLTVELPHRALNDNVKVLSYHVDVTVRQLQGRGNAELVKKGKIILMI